MVHSGWGAIGEFLVRFRRAAHGDMVEIFGVSRKGDDARAIVCKLSGAEAFAVLMTPDQAQETIEVVLALHELMPNEKASPVWQKFLGHLHNAAKHAQRGRGPTIH